MSCPDWRLLAAEDEFLRPGSKTRRGALEHAAECARCRREALRLDPSLAVAELPVGAASAAEIASIRDGVLALSRLRQVERAARPRRASARYAAVAALTVGILLFARETGERGPVDGSPGSEQPLLSEDYRLYGSLPLVESLEPAEARVYQLGRDEFSLVWIIDESIEVTTNP